jgi:hypothetical protein
MATFRRFNDIEAWQKARELTKLFTNSQGVAISRRILVCENKSAGQVCRSWPISPKVSSETVQGNSYSF